MKKVLFLVSCIAIILAVTVVAFAGSFTDVADDAYYADAAERMAEKGILSGFGDGRFYGDWELTRAQFAALACKMLGKVNEATALAGKTSFMDVPETHWSTGYVNYAAANKIINGDGDGNFRPDDPVKYEEAIKVIICVIDPDNNIKVDSSDWSKNYIAEAKKLGLTNNLIGKKGETLKRSDIAVLADKGMSLMENESKVDTTKKPSAHTPSTTTKAPETEVPKTTTAATTPAPIVVTLPQIQIPDEDETTTIVTTRREDELEEF